MIKGVNKQVLEVNETKGDFFEKAIFFVKPEYSGMSEGKLREKAKKEMDFQGNLPTTKEKTKGRLTNFLKFGSVLVLGIVIGVIFRGLL